MAKITKDKLIELIQESLGEYMDDSPEGMAGDSMAGDSMAMEPESPCAMAAEAEPMDLESQVAELKGMMQQLLDMMGGQQMMEDTTEEGK
jgi:hypothetical protein